MPGFRLLLALILVVAFGQRAAAFELRVVVDGLTAPIGLADPDDGSGTLFVLEQTGVVQVLTDDDLRERPLLDLRDKLVSLDEGFEERGLLGFALHPDTKVDAIGVGTAVVGARFYRGTAIPELEGKLIFADWSADFRTPSGQLFAATQAPVWGDLWPFEQLRQLDTRIVSLDADASGELFVLTNDELGLYGTTGKVFELVP